MSALFPGIQFLRIVRDSSICGLAIAQRESVVCGRVIVVFACLALILPTPPIYWLVTCHCRLAKVFLTLGERARISDLSCSAL